MRLDGFGLFVADMSKMIRFYRDVLGFEITEGESAVDVYLIKDGTLFIGGATAYDKTIIA